MAYFWLFWVFSTPSPPKKLILRFFHKKFHFWILCSKNFIFGFYVQWPGLGIFLVVLGFSTPNPLKSWYLGFSQKNLFLDFFAQKVGNDLVLAYFLLFWGFSTPSWFLGFSTKNFIFGFYVQKISFSDFMFNDLVWAYFWLFWVFQPPTP